MSTNKSKKETVIENPEKNVTEVETSVKEESKKEVKATKAHKSSPIATIVSNNVPVRDFPRNDAGTICRYDKGHKVCCLESVDGFTKIEVFSGMFGYVNNSYLKKAE